MTGKRHPYSTDFKMGLARDGTIVAYDVTYFQNAGAAADLSTAILERTLFHATNAYRIPHVRATAYSCRTHRAPNTAFRGFGAPQAMFAMEAAIYEAAQALRVPPHELQRRNLLSEDDAFSYGMHASNCNAQRSWDETCARYNVPAVIDRVAYFNNDHAVEKKGVALMPVCFGISFTTTALNQAGALVHIYTDGSVGISTGAVEMGQGVREKIRHIAARTFSIDPSLIKIESTNTTRVARTSPTAASTGADLNGHATRLACEAILARMHEGAVRHVGAVSSEHVTIENGRVLVDGRDARMKWHDLVMKLYLDRINLSAQAHYATPDIFFDKTTNKGSPFAYHVYGTALVEVTLDCLRGTYRIDAVRVVHDAGTSLDPVIDRGQAEGAIVQGLGWMTMEELRYADDGHLTTDTLSTYKIPDMSFAPHAIDVHFLENAPNPRGPFNSKAIGEPPFMYGIGAYFALLNAMRAFRPDLKPFYDAPLTPEKVLMKLYG